MKLISVTTSGFYGFEQNTRFEFVDDRIVCVGANGTGKSNMFKLVEFFLVHGTGPNVKLRWAQSAGAWELPRQCAASLQFSLTTAEQEAFAKWRLISILGLLSAQEDIQGIVRDLERQDAEEAPAAFAAVQVVPPPAEGEGGVEGSPLFRRLRSKQTPSKRVKAFWEVLEAALLVVYARRKPYDTAVFCANTEPRDVTSVVFQQLLCDSYDREQIVKSLEYAAVSSDGCVVVPSVSTLEDEVTALRAVLCPSGDAIHESECKGLRFTTTSSTEMWQSIERQLRYGVPDAMVDTPAESADAAWRGVPYGSLGLGDCAFRSLLSMQLYPRVASLMDVRTYISRLALETEKYMTSRPSGCRMESISGVTHVLRRVLLRSVCLLPQDRTSHSEVIYLSVTPANVEAFVTHLMESTSRADMWAVSRMQLAMRTITGQEIRSHRYFDSGRCVVGMQNVNHTSGIGEPGLKTVGGGYRELLVVVAALHGAGADTVILDSPGFSLHPPQQRALALWISKCLYENMHSNYPRSPTSIALITNSTEFITEDSLPCLYCFQRVLQRTVQIYKYDSSALSTEHPTAGPVGVPVYDSPSSDARVAYVIPPSTEIHCRGGHYAFAQLVDGSGFVSLSELVSVSEDCSQSEVAIRVKPLVSGSLHISDGLRLLDPTLKRLVFASGVFFFEGQSDYRVIEALKHVASGVSWETVIMRGAGEVSRMVKIVEALGIPYGVVVDYDQLMPTQYSKKHNNEATMSLWKVSTIRRLLVEQMQVHRPNSSSEVSQARLVDAASAVSEKRYNLASKSEAHKNLSKSLSVESLDDLVELLTTFKHNHVDDDGLAEQLQAMTTELSQYVQSNNTQGSVRGQRSPRVNKFAHILREADAIVNDSGLHPGVRAALLRKKLNSVGVFAWNADLEGMIFGYGYEAHEKLVVASMPRAIKEFCLEECESFSGIAYELYGRQSGGLSTQRQSDIDDVERIQYLIEVSMEGRLTSRELSKAYKTVFGSRFRCEINGVHCSFNVIIERLEKCSNVKITPIEDYESYLVAEKPQYEEFEPTESDAECEGDEESTVHDSTRKEPEMDPGRFFRGVVENDFDVLSDSGDIVVDSSNQKRGNEKSSRSRPPRHSSRSSSRSASPQKRIHVPRADDAVYEDSTNEYLFEWVGKEPRDMHREHPQHVFRSPSYWRFVGSVLHGSKERAGLWRQLPWAVLKDVIYCTKNIRVPDNKALCYMSTAETSKYGTAMSNAAIHVGLRDLLEWMEGMETKGLAPV